MDKAELNEKEADLTRATREYAWFAIALLCIMAGCYQTAHLNANSAYPMKFQQLRYLVAVHENDLNMTTAARRLHASQPGVSRQIALLEEELGFQLFERQGRSLFRTTEAGEDIVGRAATILRELQNIRRTSSELANADGGTLPIATNPYPSPLCAPVVALLRSDFGGEQQQITVKDVDWQSWRDFYTQGRSPRAAIERALERDI
jgi:DNA-binding transcriptional LysR family regulator